MERGVLGFAGPPGFADAVAAAARRAGLAPLIDMPGRVLFAGRGLPAAACGAGAIIGDRFGADERGAAATAGWGDYLAFENRPVGALAIERAPLTGLPLYWSEVSGGLLWFSHAQLIEGLGLRLSIDWDFIRDSLVFANLRTERTGFTAIRELLAGTRLEYDGRQVQIAPTWSPWTHVEAARGTDRHELAAELERTIVGCVGAWGAGRRAIVLELSGGLDSSIVAAALAANGVRFSAVNFVTAGPDGDERRFARAVAQCCGVELIELAHDERAIDIGAPARIPTVRPSACAALGGFDRAFEAMGPGEAALFSGIGGDNVFALTRSVAPVLDLLARRGPGVLALRTLRDVARAADTTLWQAAAVVWRQWRRGHRSRWPRDTRFLCRAAVPLIQPSHPWDQGTGGASRAARLHVAALRRILDFLDRPGRWYDRDTVAPLLSQPVVELCLAVPGWVWTEGGYDRAPARAAFARHLPPEVTRRRGKGRIESACAAAYLASRSRLKVLLLEGQLARAGLLERGAVEACLARDTLDGTFDYFRLIELADVEAWLTSIARARL